MICTSRLLLRPYTSEDWEHVHAYAAIPAFSQFEPWGPNSVEDTKRFIGACIARMSENPNARNTSSRRVMEKLGMRMVSLRPKCEEVKGVLVDRCEYELRKATT